MAVKELTSQTSGHKTRRPPRVIAGNVIYYILLSIAAFAFFFPFFWAVSTSLKRPAELLLFPPRVFPEIPQWNNYVRVFEKVPFLKWAGNTVFVVTSDHGYFYGEHGLSIERRLPYEESIRTPFIVRYPSVAKAGSRIEELVASVDIAPTVLEIAGAPIGDHIQGRSLVPLLLRAAPDWRQAVYIEFYTYENPFPWLLDMDYRAIRTGRYKYIHWMQHPNENELYDLVEDPYEMRNLVDEPHLAGVVEDLRAEMADAAVAAMGLRR